MALSSASHIRGFRLGASAVLASSLVLWLLASSAAAQTVTATTGAVSGVVTDSTKAVLPGVTVNLTGPTLILVRTTTTDGRGAFALPAVPPGDYTLTLSLAGFRTTMHEGIRVGLGFTASITAELEPGGVADNVVVRGSPVVDLASTAVSTHFDSTKLASLPGARDIFAILANTPGVAMVKMDVGGNGALAIQEYTSYGLRSTTGMHRNEVEGIRVGGANGANDNYLSDYASFSEIAVTAVGHSAAMPVPGTMAQYVSKSGGNSYRGSLSADFQDEGWQATNIDDTQVARGLTGDDARNTNRLQRFRDLTADVGGFLRRDSLWWYAAYRDTQVGQRYPWLLDAVSTMAATVGTGKLTYKLSPRQTMVGYLQRSTFQHANYFLAGAGTPVQTSDALPSLEFPVTVWKAEYNAALTDGLYVEARGGGYHSDASQVFKSTAPRIADIGANTVRGGSFGFDRLIDRPQVNGALSYVKAGWGGSHTFRIGGEYLSDRVDSAHRGYGGPCNCVSTFNNGTPAQVQLFLGANVSENDLTTAAGFIDDTWRVGQRFTLSLGLRLDRYDPSLPAQEGPAGQPFTPVHAVTFNNWGPRVGMTAALTGDGKTVLKLHYGKFWPYPSPLFAAAFNPNPAGWSRTYLWRQDVNQNGSWDPGEEGALIAAAGGTATTRLDPSIANTHVHQATAYLERVVAGDLALRTGVVVNARRDPYGTINVNRPLSAYAVPSSAADPGPDGRAGTPDDGPTVTAYGLTAEALALPPVNLTTNLPDSRSEYYTWELTATRRAGARWSLLASAAHTWHREAALGVGSDFTPNALVNTTGGQIRFTTWQAKVHATLALPHGFRAIPVVRAQSGTPFSRTFVRTLNYGNAVVRAEPISARRTADIILVDLRTEKTFSVARAHLTGFLDLYNLFNTNAEQTLTTTSGTAWLRPTAITGPRIVRIGARLEW